MVLISARKVGVIMVELKIKVKEDTPEHVDIKVVVPKNVDSATDNEKYWSKYVIDKLNEVFEKKEED